jgi:hypothetical protein
LNVVVWSKIENRRKFFESYAEKRGFDALIPDHWYLQSTTQIMAEKVTREGEVGECDVLSKHQKFVSQQKSKEKRIKNKIKIEIRNRKGEEKCVYLSTVLTIFLSHATACRTTHAIYHTPISPPSSYFLLFVVENHSTK